MLNHLTEAQQEARSAALEWNPLPGQSAGPRRQWLPRMCSGPARWSPRTSVPEHRAPHLQSNDSAASSDNPVSLEASR
jgi:hypothetical protein